MVLREVSACADKVALPFFAIALCSVVSLSAIAAVTFSARLFIADLERARDGAAAQARGFE